MSYTIDLIYVNFNNYEKIKLSIKSLYRFVNKLSVKFKIFILDNSFILNDSKFIKQFEKDILLYNTPNLSIKYIPSNSNKGFGKGCNFAAKHGSSEKLIIINPDTSFESSNPIYFEKFLRQVNEEKVIIGPKILKTNGLTQNSCFSFDPVSIILKPLRHIQFISRKMKFLGNFKFLKKRIDRISYKGIPKNKLSHVDWVSGCFMLINRKFYEQVGGFDDRFFLYFEDVDLCREARRIGKKVVYDPTFKVIHEGAHQSRSEKGIVGSIMKNNTARLHIYSWAQYVYKWRYDFLYKLICKFHLVLFFAELLS